MLASFGESLPLWKFIILYRFDHSFFWRCYAPECFRLHMCQTLIPTCFPNNGGPEGCTELIGGACQLWVCSPPARWGLLDFMSVASSSSSFSSFSSSSSPPPPPRPPRPPRHPRPPAQLRPSTHSVLCRTSTTTIHAQCSLPDLNHDHPRPVFPAGPQPRPSPPSVPCRTSTTTIHAQCSLPDLNREYPRQVFPAGPHEICQIESQKICQMEC